MPRATRRSRSLASAPFGLLVAVLAAIASAPVAGGTLGAQEPMRGKVRRDLYTAPSDRFTVPVPKGMKVSDAHAADHGAFSLWDSSMRTEGFLYTIEADSSGDVEAFRGWVRARAMPTFLTPASAASRVMADSAGSFAGRPALYVLLDIPGGGAAEVTTMSGGKVTRGRADSRRVGVVLQSGTWRVLVFTETATFFGKAATPDGEWLRYAADLERFWAAVRFPR